MQLAGSTVSGSNRKWPQSSRRISAPWHSAIGFGTKLPTRSGNSEYPQNTCTPAGWFGKCGWWASTMDISQFESLSVTSPPMPASLPLNWLIASKNRGFFSDSLKDYDLVKAKNYIINL